jgi:hypothetical protein
MPLVFIYDREIVNSPFPVHIICDVIFKYLIYFDIQQPYAIIPIMHVQKIHLL